MGSSIHFRLANSNIFPNVLTGKCSNACYGFLNGGGGGGVCVAITASSHPVLPGLFKPSTKCILCLEKKKKKTHILPRA